ncbi:hypothetical protein NKH77_14425 [Streptomyces sp. M19]
MTHETTHVATRRATTATTRCGSPRVRRLDRLPRHRQQPRQVAPELAAAVSAGRSPGRCPWTTTSGSPRTPTGSPGRTRRVDGLPDDRAAVERGEARGAVPRGRCRRGERAEAVDSALREVLGVDTARFTRLWRAYLEAELR